VSCWALARACQPLIETDGATALVDVGWTCASLCVMWRGSIIYERTVEEGGLLKLSSELAQALGAASPIEALRSVEKAETLEQIDPQARQIVREILDRMGQTVGEDVRAALKFAEHRYGWGGGSRLVVSGELPGLAGRIGRGVGMDAEVVTSQTIFDGIDEHDRNAHMPTSFARAVGLALWEVPR